METRAHFVTVGAFVLVLLTGLLGTVVWLAKWQADRQFAYYDIVFSGSVQGIRRGSPVNLLGIGVGQVSDIRIEDVNRVRATIELAASTPIREGTRASVEPQGFTGGAVIRLTPGAATAPPLAVHDGERYPRIPSDPGRIERLIEGAPQLVDRLELILAKLAMLISKDNIDAVSNALRNVDAATASLAQNAAKFDKTADDAAAMVASGRQAADRIARLSTALDSEIRGVMSQANRTMAHADGVVTELRNTARTATRTADSARRFFDDNRTVASDFANSSLYEFGSLVSDMRELIAVINRIAGEVERDPTRFLFGKRQDGFDAK